MTKSILRKLRPSQKDDLGKFYEETFREVKQGGVVKGTIVKLIDNFAVVDIGYKSEGIVRITEFRQPEPLSVGDEVEVLIEKLEDENGQVVLSREQAVQQLSWNKIASTFKEGGVVEGKITRQVKGGFIVNIGLEGFLPSSQVGLRRDEVSNQLLGTTLKFKIISLDFRKKNVIVSHRTLIEKEREESRGKIMAEIEKGQRKQGVVKNITDFGAFVDIGGIDGLLHVTDISWKRIGHPREALNVGDKIEVMVLEVDKEKLRISLGLKQTKPNPWDNVEEKYTVGGKHKGKVNSVTDYGAFVELEEGIEGLIHISEMSWTKKVVKPSEILKAGDEIEVTILAVDKENGRISLGIKDLQGNPWLEVENKYPVGTKVKGKVNTITNYGAFVTLEEGVDGLIHASDMSWSGKAGLPRDALKKGEEIETIVLSVNAANRRLALGLKQLKPDPWKDIETRYKVGQVVNGVATKLVNFGAFVQIEDGIEGLIHISQISTKHIGRPEEALKVGQNVEAKIIKMDPVQRKIGLSIVALLEGSLEDIPKKETPPTEQPPEQPAEETEDKPCPPLL
ncbi:MAG: 30S ribosomal protein S1 [Candidatus Omnitrophica bacterium]|nr:30S ribosomal protein S1 [Candidatus Omnitrophota bacterium]